MSMITPKGAYRKLAALYDKMVASYADAAREIGLTCEGCADNCCFSFFQHHTYVEWAYLWQGLNELDQGEREAIVQKSREYVEQAQTALSRGERPRIMCPLNLDEAGGKCGLYQHRLMICRLHGVPNSLTLPNGRQTVFPGCSRTQQLTEKLSEQGEDIPTVDRSSLYGELARLEMSFLGKKVRKLPKVNHTIAEMIVLGPPKF